MHEDGELISGNQNKIESLKSVSTKASELKKTSCSKCAEFFQSTIAQSLENLNKKLQKITIGVLRKRVIKGVTMNPAKFYTTAKEQTIKFDF